jgi:hypothetical protein
MGWWRFTSPIAILLDLEEPHWPQLRRKLEQVTTLPAKIKARLASDPTKP